MSGVPKKKEDFLGVRFGREDVESGGDAADNWIIEVLRLDTSSH